MIDSDSKAILRTVRDALLEARGYVATAAKELRLGVSTAGTERAPDVLTAIDNALAEADEVLT